MKSLSIQNIVLIIASIFISLVLFIIPSPSWAIWFKPPWVEMIIFFWILYFPQQFNLFFAWFAGLLIDILTNAPLGEHAATLIFSAYLVRKFYQRLRMFPLWQQSAAISIILLIHQIVLFWIQHLVGQQAAWIIWLPPLFSFFLWPFITISLKYFFKKTFLPARY